MLLLTVIFLLFLLVVFSEFIYPFKRLKVQNCTPKEFEPQKQKTFTVHVHTCYSYDSLGKVEEIERAAKLLNLQKVFTTDHENDTVKIHKSPLIVAGREFQHNLYGRLLKLGETFTVIAHPNNTRKKEYEWKGHFKRDFFYELIDLKDVIYEAPLWLKLYLVLRFWVLYPFKGLKALDFFPKLVPIFRWVNLYLQRTEGELKIIGGLDHHVKLTFWEKAHRSFSFPPYLWSFYILSNKTFGGKIFSSLQSGSFYISFCHFEVSKSGNYLTYRGRKVLTFNFFGHGKFKVNNCGFVEENTKIVVLAKYSFRLKGFYFGLTPLAVLKVN